MVLLVCHLLAGKKCWSRRLTKDLRDAAAAQIFCMPPNKPSSRMQLSAEEAAALESAAAIIRKGGVMELYARLRQLHQTVPFIFVTEQVGSVVRVAPLGIGSPGGIATLVSIAPDEGVTVKYRLSSLRTEVVHPSRIGAADSNSQLLGSAMASSATTRSSSGQQRASDDATGWFYKLHSPSTFRSGTDLCRLSDLR